MIDHCEDLNLSAGGDMHEGVRNRCAWACAAFRRCSEDVMVARDILLAELTGARYHVAHISTRHSVEMVAFAKAPRPARDRPKPRRTISPSTDADMPPYDSNYKMKPPLRSPCDVGAVVEGIVAGAIDAIATDHAPHAGSEKMQEFEKCPFGIFGLETALGMALEQLVHPGKIDSDALGGAVHDRPGAHREPQPRRVETRLARRRHDLSTDREWTYDVNKSFSKSRNSPFDGHTFRGGPVATTVNGRVVWQA